MDAGVFAFMDYTARIERRRDESFGGLRIVLMGDPCQMGPRGADIYHPFRPLVIPPSNLNVDEVGRGLRPLHPPRLRRDSSSTCLKVRMTT